MSGDTQPSTSLQKGMLNPTPLWVIGLFVSLSEIAISVGIVGSTGFVQVMLALFAIAFPSMIAFGFFRILGKKPWLLYAPAEYQGVDAVKFIKAIRGAEEKIETTSRRLDSVLLIMAESRMLELDMFIRGTMCRPNEEEKTRIKCHVDRLREHIASRVESFIAEGHSWPFLLLGPAFTPG